MNLPIEERLHTTQSVKKTVSMAFSWNLKEYIPKLKLQLGIHRFFTFPRDFEKTNGVNRLNLVQSGFFLNSQMRPQCYYCAYEITDLPNWKTNINELHEKNSPDCPLMTELVEDFPIYNTENYAFESYRLYSFLIADWPNPYISPFDLAKNGFYFTQEGDNCRCYFCKLEVREWEQGDKAQTEHLRWNEKCQFLTRYSTCNNIEIGDEAVPENRLNPEEMQHRLLKKVGALNVKRNKSSSGAATKAITKNLGTVYNRGSKHPFMNGIKDRTQTFEKWPKSKNDLVPELCKAGFYYTDRSDLCICFHCDVHLKEWELDNNPWDEHRKYSPECAFLKLFYEPVEDESTPINTLSSHQLDIKCQDCHVKEANTTSLPCGHVSYCEECAEQHQKCPRCEKEYYFFLKFFLC